MPAGSRMSGTLIEKAKPEPRADVTIEFHGSIVGIRPNTEPAREWIAENVDEDAPWFGGALVCEPRYLDDIGHAMVSDGLEVE